PAACAPQTPCSSPSGGCWRRWSTASAAPPFTSCASSCAVSPPPKCRRPRSPLDSLPWYVTLSAIFGAVVALTFLGSPVFVVFLLVNVTGILLFLGPSAFGMFANSLVSTLTNEAFITVPLFLLMGEMLSHSRAIEELYEAFDGILGATRIRLYTLCTLVATVVGTVSGSAMADAAMLGRSIYPGMIERGYDKKMSTGLILAGATIAPIIPPSILTVVLAIIANASVAKLLIAGTLPG